MNNLISRYVKNCVHAPLWAMPVVFESAPGKRRDRLVRSVVFFTGDDSRTLSGSGVALSTGCFFPPVEA